MSSTPASVSAEKFYKSKDHFFRFRKHLTAYARALSADPRCSMTTFHMQTALYQGVQKHLCRFPSDILLHKATRDLVATLTYFWSIENSDTEDPPFDLVEDPDCVVCLLCFVSLFVFHSS